MVDKNTPVAPDIVGLLEGISTTRAIRRYLDEPIPDEVLRDIMFAAKYWGMQNFICHTMCQILLL